MESDSQDWASLLPAVVMIIVAIVVVVLAGVGVARVNDYQHAYNDVDMITQDEWSGTTADSSNSGQSKVTGVQNMFIASIVASLVLSIITTYATYKLFGTAAASVYAIVMLITMIAWMAYTYYLSYVGKNRVATSGGEIENSDDVDVQHGLLSSINVNFAVMIFHALATIILGAYSLFSSHKAGKAASVATVIHGPGYTAVSGSGRSRPTHSSNTPSYGPGPRRPSDMRGWWTPTLDRDR